jgi:hypothetical protein
VRFLPAYESHAPHGPATESEEDRKNFLDIRVEFTSVDETSGGGFLVNIDLAEDDSRWARD